MTGTNGTSTSSRAPVDSPHPGRHRWSVPIGRYRVDVDTLPAEAAEANRTSTILPRFVVVAVAVMVFGVCAAAFAIGAGVSTTAAVLIAAFLAVLSGCVNRFLVGKVVAPRRLRDNIVATLAGTALALPIGALVAGSVCLGAFRGPIDDERVAAVLRQSDDQLTNLRQQVAPLQDKVTAAATAHPEADPTLVELQRRLDAKDRELTDAEKARREERAGENGTGVGPGERWQEYDATVRRLVGERHDLAEQVEAERPLAQKRAQEEAGRRAEPVQKQLDGVVAEISSLEKRRADGTAAVDRADVGAGAQLARAGTLFSLLATSPIAPAFWCVLLGYLILQVSPVLMRRMCGSWDADLAAVRSRDLRNGRDPASPRVLDRAASADATRRQPVSAERR